jgi:phosphate starvation-inducible membrane PsiE
MLNKIITIVAGLFGFLLVAIGLRWLIDPSGSAEALGMPLLDGVGRSTQIGDLSAFFVFSGVFALLGIFTRNPSMLLAPAVLMGLTAIFRTVATVHGAPFATDMIVPEVLMCVFFLLARRRMTSAE